MPAGYHCAAGCFHRLVRQDIAQIGQGTDDSIVTPVDILFGHPYNQGFEFRLNAWAAWITTSLGPNEFAGD